MWWRYQETTYYIRRQQPQKKEEDPPAWAKAAAVFAMFALAAVTFQSCSKEARTERIIHVRP